MSDWTLALLNLQPMRHSVENAVELEHAPGLEKKSVKSKQCVDWRLLSP